MKKLRVLSLVLALVTLMGLTTLFTACKKTDGIVTLKGGEKKVDIAGYTLVYGNPINTTEFTTTYQNRIAAFADQLSARTGEKYPAFAVSRTKSTPADPEILIGATPRAESQEALASISGNGFVITMTENKIVIVGTTNLLTLMAVEYFADKYLAEGEEKSTTLSIHKSAMANDVEQVTIATSARGEDKSDAKDYTYVYSKDIGQLPSSYAGTGSDHSSSTYKEYEQIAADELSTLMQKLTGLGGKYFPTKTDKESYEKEIQIGRIERDENRAVLADVAANEFVVAVEGRLSG